jgi:hypothetical protein
MSESLDRICDDTLDHVLNLIFTKAANKQYAVEFTYEFADPRVAKRCVKKLADYGVELSKATRKVDKFVYDILVEEVMRTKFLVVMRTAKKMQRYRELKKEVDFTLHGYDWKPTINTSDINDDRLSLCNKIFLKTYGEMKL